MKSNYLVLFCLACTFGIQAQSVDLGLTAGYLNAEGKFKADGVSISASESGFYIGAVADFGLTSKIHLQPELVYASVDGSDGLILPIMFRYYVAPKFNLQLGPQFVFTLEDVPDDFTGVEFDLAGGVGFDITDAFFTEARYSFQINNSYTGSEDVTVRGNYLMIGLGYTF